MNFLPRMHEQNLDPLNQLVRAVIENNVEKVLNYIRIIPEDGWKKTIFTLPLPPVGVAEATRKSSQLLIPPIGLSLLHIAAFEDSLESFILLNRIPLTIQSADLYLPIHYACLNGSKEVLTYILTMDPSQAYTEYRTEYNCLQLATFSNSPEILKILFDYGAELKTRKFKTYSNNDPISVSIKQRNVECLKILLKHTGDSLKCVQNMTPIMLALVNNKPDAVPILIDAKVDLAYIDSENQTALSIACFQGQKEVVKLICSHLENIDLPPEIHAKAAVHWLCQSKDPEIAEIMLAKNIDVNRVDNDGHIGPHYLLDVVEPSVHIKILQLLVDAGLNIDYVSNPNMNTLLGDYVMSIQKQFEVMDWLLEHGASIDAPLRSIISPKDQSKTIAEFIFKTLKSTPKDQSNDQTLGFRRLAEKWMPDRYAQFLKENNNC